MEKQPFFIKLSVKRRSNGFNENNLVPDHFAFRNVSLQPIFSEILRRKKIISITGKVQMKRTQ